MGPNPIFQTFLSSTGLFPANDPAKVVLDRVPPLNEKVDEPPANLPDSEQAVLRLLRYRNQVLPDGTIPSIAETPAHLDVRALKVHGPYSLHTEYSSKSRAVNSPLLDGLETIKASQRRGVPELWTSRTWAEEFSEFIFRLVGESEPPTIIEIHPPFVSSLSTLEAFLDVYEVFETAILARFPDCRIVIENRSGTKHPHRFLLSDAESILALGRALATRSLRLGIAFDVPQMYTQERGSKHLLGIEDVSLLERLAPIGSQIHTLHLWGRGDSGGAHSGGLDGLFSSGTGAKEACLSVLKRMFEGGRRRHLVLEVTRQEDLISILEDLGKAGFACETGR